MLSFVLSNTWDGRYTIKSFLMRLFQSRTCIYFWLFDGEFVCYVHVHEGCVSVCWRGGVYMNNRYFFMSIQYEPPLFHAWCISYPFPLYAGTCHKRISGQITVSKFQDLRLWETLFDIWQILATSENDGVVHVYVPVYTRRVIRVPLKIPLIRFT